MDKIMDENNFFYHSLGMKNGLRKLKIIKCNILDSLKIKNEIQAKLKNKNIILAFVLTKWVLL